MHGLVVQDARSEYLRGCQPICRRQSPRRKVLLQGVDKLVQRPGVLLPHPPVSDEVGHELPWKQHITLSSPVSTKRAAANELMMHKSPGPLLV